MLKKVILLTAFITATFLSKAQDKSIASAYQHNFFSLSLRCGLNKAEFIPLTGPNVFNSKMGIVPSLNFEYQWNIHPSIGISMAAGFGFYPFRFNLEELEQLNIPLGSLQAIGRNTQIYGRVLPGINFHKSVSDKLMYNATLRAGFASVGVSSSGWQFGDSTFLNYQYFGSIKGMLSIETGMTYFLRNKDLIGVNLSYEHLLQPVARGTYFDGETNGSGTILNKGHNFGLSLTYTFTQLNKKNRIEEITKRNNISDKTSKKEFRKERRFIAPNSTFIGFGNTVFGLKSAVIDPSNYFLTTWGLSGGFYIETEQGMGKDYFIEFRGEGLQFNQNILTSDMRNNFGYTLFWVGRLSFGAGKRFILKASNRNVLNLHAGFSLNYTRQEIGESIGNGTQTGPDSEDYFELNSNEFQKKQIFPTLYTTVEKDFRLANRFYFSVKYRLDFGLVDVHELELNYKTDENALEFNQATSVTRGTTHGASFGFKFKL